MIYRIMPEIICVDDDTTLLSEMCSQVDSELQDFIT